MRTKHREATVYDTTTRSTLEARWAIFFRELNLTWKYEPPKLYGQGRVYTPDFLVEGFGYVEIKPTLELFIQESAERVVAIAGSNPKIKIYVFCSNRVEISTVALYKGDKLFAPTPIQIYRLLSFSKTGGAALSADQIDANIKRAMTIANTTKLNEWRSTKDVLLDVIEGLEKHLSLKITTSPRDSD